MYINITINNVSINNNHLKIYDCLLFLKTKKHRRPLII